MKEKLTVFLNKREKLEKFIDKLKSDIRKNPKSSIQININQSFWFDMDIEELKQEIDNLKENLIPFAKHSKCQLKIMFIKNNYRGFETEEIEKLEKVLNAIKDVKFYEYTVDMSINQIKKTQSIINKMAEDVKKQNLSPLETAMYAYNKCTQFSYKKSKGKKNYAQTAQTSLLKGEIVCQAYADIFVQLLEYQDNTNLIPLFNSCEHKTNPQEKEMILKMTAEKIENLLNDIKTKKQNNQDCSKEVKDLLNAKKTYNNLTLI